MTPVLYILMRNDMDSLNPGKAMAQAAHAANAFVGQMIERDPEDNLTIEEQKLLSAYIEWKFQAQPQNFGTTIVLASNLEGVRRAVVRNNALGNIANLVLDPTYPLKDGQTTHLIPVHTCAYVFGYKENIMLEELELHP